MVHYFATNETIAHKRFVITKHTGIELSARHPELDKLVEEGVLAREPPLEVVPTPAPTPAPAPAPAPAKKTPPRPSLQLDKKKSPCT